MRSGCAARSWVRCSLEQVETACSCGQNVVLLAEGEAHQVLPIVAVVREHVDRNGRDADPLGQCAAEISRIGFAQRSDIGKEEVRAAAGMHHETRSEEHTSELPSLMRSPYAVFCL